MTVMNPPRSLYRASNVTTNHPPVMIAMSDNILSSAGSDGRISPENVDPFSAPVTRTRTTVATKFGAPLRNVPRKRTTSRHRDDRIGAKNHVWRFRHRRSTSSLSTGVEPLRRSQRMALPNQFPAEGRTSSV